MYHQPAALPGLGGAYLYLWNDDRCNMKHNFICKYRAGAEPPASLCCSCRLHILFSLSDLVREQADTRGGRGTGEEETSSGK